MAAPAPKIAGLVLAAGKSTRMGANKLLADLGGKPLVRHCVEALTASNLRELIVVTGKDSDGVKAALEPFAVTFIHNPQFAEGLSSSLNRGLGTVPADAEGVLICLGDMPLVDVKTVNQLVATFDPAEHRSICVPTFEGKRGNPVLWGRQHFKALSSLAGDQGGKRLMDSLGDEIFEVAVSSKGILLDVDTPDALQEIKSVLKL